MAAKVDRGTAYVPKIDELIKDKYTNGRTRVVQPDPERRAPPDTEETGSDDQAPAQARFTVDQPLPGDKIENNRETP